MAAFNGSGTFSRSYNWVVDRIAGTPITDTRMDTEMDGVATGLSSCIVKDGQTTTTARIPFAVGIGMNDGTSALPAINFTSDTNSGVYRIGADNIGVTAGGAKVLDISTTGLGITGSTLAGDGTVSLPGIAFSADTNSGVYRIGADNIGIGVAGAKVLDISATGLGVTGTTLTGDGTVSLPGISFVSDPDSGIYRVGSNAISVTLAGAAVLALTTAGAAVTGTLSASGATTLAAVSATTGAFSSTVTSAAHTVTSSAVSSFAVGTAGATNPAIQIDASTASSATGIKIKSAAAAAGVAISVISSGTDEALTIDAKGSGTITLGGTSTGAITLTRATTMSAALTYGGVTLSNAVTGTGNMVLSTSPSLSGTVGGNLTFSGTHTLSSALTYGGVTLSNAVTGTGNMVLSASPTFTGTVIAAAISPTGIVAISNSTASTSTTTGALTVAGGLGVAGAFYVGANISSYSITGPSIETNATWGSLNNPSVGYYNAFIFNQNAVAVGSIQVSTTTTAYATSSDARLKDDPRAFDGGSIIDRLKVYNFSWRRDGSRAFGVFAQEVFPVFPDAVVKPQNDKDYWGVDYSKFVPLLLSDAQRSHGRFSAVETEIDRLTKENVTLRGEMTELQRRLH